MILTPRNIPQEHITNLVGDGLNFSMHLVQLARRIPSVDPRRVGLIGGSAGGYQTLIVCAEAFPVTAAVANVPLVNLAYNLLYVRRNDSFNEGLKPEEMPVPVLSVVRPIADETAKALGEHQAGGSNWGIPSPNQVMGLVTNPTLMLCSTADILVPVNQFSDNFVRGPPQSFPEGFAFSLEELVPEEGSRERLMDLLPEDETDVFIVKVPEDAPLQPKYPPTPGQTGVRPRLPFITPRFSDKARFSLMVYDEGAPTPQCNHFKYQHTTRLSDFFAYHFSKPEPLPRGMLTYPKLVRLMERMGYEERIRTYDRKGSVERPMRRRNRLPLERLDIVSGLEAFIEGGENRANLEHLVALYSKLPDELRNLDVKLPSDENGVQKRVAGFQEEPVPGLLYHKAVICRSLGDDELSGSYAERLLNDHISKLRPELPAEPGLNTP